MLEPLVVIPIGEVITCMRAAALCPGLSRHHGRHCYLDQVVEFQRFDPSGIEYTALVPDRSLSRTLSDVAHFCHALPEHVGESKYATMGLHGFAHCIAHLRYAFTVLLTLQTGQPRQRLVGSIWG